MATKCGIPGRRLNQVFANDNKKQAMEVKSTVEEDELHYVFVWSMTTFFGGESFRVCFFTFEFFHHVFENVCFSVSASI